MKKFKSNNCIAIHLEDLKKAEQFYSDVLGFKLLSKTTNQLEYDTGHFLLYINRSKQLQSPIPSFSVKNINESRKLLVDSGCKILVNHEKSLYFQDPFGMIYDVIED